MTAKSRATLNSDADTNIYDSGAGDVSTTDVRLSVKDLADSSFIKADDPLGFRNLLINADGRFNQRAPATNADDTYGHDRWYALTQTSTIAVSTVTDAENGTPKMWRLTQSQASAQRMGYAQIIEGANCKRLRGKSVTLSGRIKFSLNAALRYAILEWTGTEDVVTSDVVSSWTNGTFTAGQFFNSTTLNVIGVGTITPAAATLADLTALTATVGSSANNLIVLIWTEGTAAQNATLDGAIQLEIGEVAGVREFRPYSTELALCQRYYEIGTAYYEGYDTINAPVGMNIKFSVLKRASPTLAYASFSGTNCSRPATRVSSAESFGRYVLADSSGAMWATENWTADAEL